MCFNGCSLSCKLSALYLSLLLSLTGAERMSVVITDKKARWTFPRLGTFSWYTESEQTLMTPSHNPWHFVLMLRSMKMREYGNVMAFEVNMYYKINLDEDLPIPLIRRGDWRLIFNCKSNYMEQIASDIWLSRWLIKRPGCWGRLSASWIQTKEKIKKVVPFVITNFKGEITKPNIPLEKPSILPLCSCLPSYLTPAVTTASTQGPCDMLKGGNNDVKNELRNCSLTDSLVRKWWVRISA